MLPPCARKLEVGADDRCGHTTPVVSGLVIAVGPVRVGHRHPLRARLLEVIEVQRAGQIGEQYVGQR